MTSDDLFARENALISLAEDRLNEWGDETGREAFELLSTEYRKLLRVTRRMMRISDRNEEQLNLLAAQQRSASEEISRKNRELELLSDRLSKYLSPQVYASIFDGRQEVKLASRREKLTVFFSDIAEFTPMTERMESEDLTRLLNQYLTEMSDVANEYGGTVDKFVGDAVMIFFGDPETRGVKEDALACVRMAIEMQRRLAALSDRWRREGVRDRVQARMGINTGYCTVGNFGSDDRMDYTIIGGAVNIASRLEKEAPIGGILMSYETWAHVRDEIECESRGVIDVRGSAYPVETYSVTDPLEGTSAFWIRRDLPHFQLFLDPRALSDVEREESAAILRDALAAVTKPGEPAEPARAFRAGKPRGRRRGVRHMAGPPSP